MTRFFKGAALFALIACGVWIAVLWHWQSTVRDISTRDIVMYLGVLPVMLFVFAWLLRWAWLGLADKQAQRSAADAASLTAGSGAATAESNADDLARHATVQLLAAHLVCAAGESAGDLQSAAKDGAPRPALDPALRDEDGLPIVAARIRDLDIPTVEARFEPLVTSTHALRVEWAGLVPDEHVVRALAALERPLASAVESLLPWAGRFLTDPHAAAATAVEVERAPERRVRVLLGWPATWSDFEQALGRAWALDCLGTSGGGVIAEARFAATVHAGSGEELLLHADRLLQTLAREGRDDPLIVASCHSAIGQTAVDALERDGALFGAKRPKGQMPGEAAAALLLANADWPAAPDADGPVPHLQRPALLRRDKSVDAGGRINGDVVVQAIAQALATGRIGAEAVAGLACDADQHTPRAAEFYGASVATLPALDSTEDMRLIGTVTGSVGAVGPLLVVACAAERAVATEKPHLAVTLGDPVMRLALVVWPRRPPAPAPAPENAATKAAAT